MTSMVCDPTNPDRIWAGAAGGGVWHSRDGGRNWRSLWHRQKSLNVGSLAIDPGDPQLIYCGTGEANLSADSYAGVGLYRTINGGRSWQLFASSARSNMPTRIGVIAIDPFDTNHIRIAGVGYDRAEPGGMYVSRDRGVTWQRDSSLEPNRLRTMHLVVGKCHN